MKNILKGIIFDLDGTLIDSQLDFKSMKQEMGLKQECNILEELDKLPGGIEKTRLWHIVNSHEKAGLDKSKIYPGVGSFLAFLESHNIKIAILTRNSSLVALESLKKFKIDIDLVLAREDVRIPKPHPEGLFYICRSWRAKTNNVIFIGDYIHDLLAGKNAAIQTMLFKQRADSDQFIKDATASFDCYLELKQNFNLYLEKLNFEKVNQRPI